MAQKSPENVDNWGLLCLISFLSPVSSACHTFHMSLNRFIKSPLVLFVLSITVAISAHSAPVKQRTSKVISQKDQEKKDQALVLAKKRELSRKPTMVIPPILAKSSAANEQVLYSEILSNFDNNNEIGFRARYQMFMSKYAQSRLADEVLYLSGTMALANKNYGLALSDLNKILTKYPNSNKASAALFAKGIVLKRMNLTENARTALLDVTKKYKGSPEALRAQTELKILK